jgi:hypothetical protein
MLSGQRLFIGDTVAHTLAAVLQTPVDFDKLTAPAPIKNMVCRCLDRDVKNRLQWIGEARFVITKYLADPASIGTDSGTRAARLPYPPADVDRCRGSCPIGDRARFMGFPSEVC